MGPVTLVNGLDVELLTGLDVELVNVGRVVVVTLPQWLNKRTITSICNSCWFVYGNCSLQFEEPKLYPRNAFDVSNFLNNQIPYDALPFDAITNWKVFLYKIEGNEMYEVNINWNKN